MKTKTIFVRKGGEYGDVTYHRTKPRVRLVKQGCSDPSCCPPEERVSRPYTTTCATELENVLRRKLKVGVAYKITFKLERA
jgi:hypothetical protein